MTKFTGSSELNNKLNNESNNKSSNEPGEYLFVLGRNEELSILELESYFSARKIFFKIKERFRNLIIIEMQKCDFSRIINDLGGVLKIAERFDLNFQNLDKIGFLKNKINYGINEYEGEFDEGVLRKYFRQEKIKGMRKYSRSTEIMPSNSLKLNLEFIVFKKIYKVAAVYNPKMYKTRDIAREFIEPEKMLSLRMAKIMINLSGVVSGAANGVLADPFCGLGTVLQEACLMGIKCVGIENDAGISEKCRKNLKNYAGWKVITGNAGQIDKIIDKVDGVATEPYMGPFLRKIPKYEEAFRTAQELKQIYSGFLQGLAKVLRGKAVMIVPLFKTNKGKIDLRFNEMLLRNGFKVLQGFPYLYAPKGCKLERQIYVFSKQTATFK